MAEKSFGVKEINLIGASGTPTIDSPNNLNLNAVNVAISTNVSIGGTLSVTGNVSVGGTLTYEDVTNIDVVGIATFRDDVKINEDKELTFDGADGGKIYADGSNFLVEGTNQSGSTYIRGGGALILSGGSASSHQTTIQLDKPGGNGRCRLYYGGNSKLETTSTGIDVTGGITIGGNPLTVDPSDTDVQVTFDIAGNSSGGYTFTGPGNDGTTGNPDIYLIRGQRYRFNNTTTTNHPFEFRNADNNADYTDGISGSQSGIQDFNVQYDAPARLKYRCTIHTSTMIGDIYIVGAFPKISVSGQSDVVADNLADTLTLAAGSNITLTTDASTDTITIAASGGGGTGTISQSRLEDADLKGTTVSYVQEKIRDRRSSNLSNAYLQYIDVDTYSSVNDFIAVSSSAYGGVTFDIRGSSSKTFKDTLDVGKTITIKIFRCNDSRIKSGGNSSHIIDQIRLDGDSSHHIYWKDGNTWGPSTSNQSGVEVYQFDITKISNSGGQTGGSGSQIASYIILGDYYYYS